MLKKIVLIAFVGVASLVSFKLGHSGAEVSLPPKALACDLGWWECCEEVQDCLSYPWRWACTYCDGS